MTGRAFHRQRILLKYASECLEVLFAPKECRNLCALASRDEKGDIIVKVKATGGISDRFN